MRMGYWWSIKFVISFLFLSQTVRWTCGYLCSESLTRVEVPDEESSSDDYYNDYINATRWEISSSMTTCINITNINVLPLEHFREQKYEQFLEIMQSNVSTIPSSAFVRFHSITSLRLSGIHIQFVYPEAFANLTRLQRLYLDNNDLTVLSNGVYNSLKQLEVLKLGNNEIQEIEKNALVGTEKLLELYLNDNQIEVLDGGVFETLQYLTLLDLSGNPLKKFDSWTTSSLRKLWLSRLSLSEVDLSNSSVKFLNLSSNQLSTVDFCRLPATQQLDLSNNQIGSLENLTTFPGNWVSFDSNKIVTVAGPFPDVIELYLSHNQIKVLEGSPFNQSQSLTILDFGFNWISTINSGLFSRLIHLDKLLLHHNNLTSLEVGTFRNLTALTVLDLSHNNIEEFRFGIFDSLGSLKALDISHNKLSNLHQYTFNALTKLSNLYFDYNNITSFEVTYLSDHLRSLSKISLDKNPWSCQKLASIQHALKYHFHRVHINEGDSYDVENFHGIACINRKEVGEFQTALTQGVENFITRELKDTKLFKYLDGKSDENDFSDFLEAQKHQLERISSNKGLVAVGAVQVVVSSLVLLVLVGFVFVYLKKERLYRRLENSSRMELYGETF